MPRKGERFMGRRERERARVRNRRRRVFTFLLEATVLTLLMGAFPPFRVVLYATAIFAGLLVVYVALLLKIRADARARARVATSRAYRAQQRAMASGLPYRRMPVEQRPAVRVRRMTVDAGRAQAQMASGQAGSNGNGHAVGNGNGDGHGRVDDDALLRESGIRILDDAHVVIRRAADVEAEASSDEPRLALAR